MASSWILTRETGSGKRYRVLFRLGGSGAKHHYAGSFKTKSDARERRKWVDSELAARRIPDLRALEVTAGTSPTLQDASTRWRESRADDSDGPQVLHRVALGRVLPILGTSRIDEITVDDVN